ncbi:LOW QUALITY PROTEIN: reverse transcriptase [Phytophthora megakarya]|uniref:Reverse transcriptase n=1 Tax=Phytophthora megakarya TaxID=4795 RepID=A0A225WHL7_9STRA|nr:LOW QUALITY PROTEIN: reverse transcriptase [Phytophthora megakarya]
MRYTLSFHPEPVRTRRVLEPVLLLEDGSGHNDESSVANNDDPENDDHFWPPSPKRPRFDEDSLLAEATSAMLMMHHDVSAGDGEQLVFGMDENNEWKFKTHVDNGPWMLVSRTPSARLIGYCWVFAKKRDGSGRVTRYKARLVGEGFKQNFGVTFFETYSPVANMTLIRVVVVALEYVTGPLDADTAFLNSDRKERMYMEVPYGISNNNNMMC